MAKVFACVNLTLDGVMQSPGRRDEDARDGFTQGGWGAPYNAMMAAGDVFGSTGALLLGRRTYLDFYDVWPTRDSPFTPWLNDIPKYVASRTLAEPLPWMNSTLLRGDAAGAVTELKRSLDKNMLIMGSGELIQSLMAGGAIDEFVLLWHPIVLGEGRKLFPAGGVPATLRLLSSSTTSTGVVAATYAASGDQAEHIITNH